MFAVIALGGALLGGSRSVDIWAPWASVLAPLRGEHVPLEPRVPAQPVTDRVVVRWADDATAAAEIARQAATPDPGVTNSALIAPRLQVVTTAPGRAAAVADILAARPGAVHSAPDARVSIAGWPDDGTTPPNDPYFARYQWDLPVIGLEAGWARTTGVAAVVVAILDTGLAAHPDLAARIVSPFDALTGGLNPTDGHGHGTHVAGTIAAATDNAAGVAGIAPGISLMPVKVLDDAGQGYFSDLVRGLDWARAHGAMIVSLSLGGQMGADEAAIYAPAFEAAIAAGMTIVAASGNDGRNNVTDIYPAAYPGVLAVGSTGPADRLSWFSNAGPGLFIAAPGESIVSLAPGGGYAVMSGTSMATPHVAGVVALLRSLSPRASKSALEAAMCAGAADLGPAGRDSWFGCGRVDAGRAMAILLGEPTPSAAPARSAAPRGSLFPLPTGLPRVTAAPLAQPPLVGATTASAAVVAYDPGNACPSQPRTIRFGLAVSGLTQVASVRLFLSINGGPFVAREMTATQASKGIVYVATMDTSVDTPGTTAGSITYYSEASNPWGTTRAPAAAGSNTIELRVCRPA